MPKQINSAAVGQRLVQLFSLKGRFQPVLDEVIVPVVSVDPEGVERKPAAGKFFQAAGGAGTYVFGYLLNPSSSGIIVRVTRIVVPNSLTVDVLMPGLGQSILPLISGGASNATTERWSEGGIPGIPTAQVLYGTSTTATSGSAQMALSQGSAQQQIPFPVPIVLKPGDIVQITTEAANTAMGGSFEWTEEPIVSDGFV